MYSDDECFILRVIGVLLIIFIIFIILFTCFCKYSLFRCNIIHINGYNNKNVINTIFENESILDKNMIYIVKTRSYPTWNIQGVHLQMYTIFEDGVFVNVIMGKRYQMKKIQGDACMHLVDLVSEQSFKLMACVDSVNNLCDSVIIPIHKNHLSVTNCMNIAKQESISYHGYTAKRYIITS